ncbi:MAG TPA: aminotransferase class I/II-fold pyridoxal phosphate-dependent enzyme, partial [Burkholderiaceae bacterium]|nr:aminotransferase class I/II-fold pyridoxal phosphate-dependent enzyme [Burkholderiaceae bacterium]
MTLFSNVELAPRDPILGITEQFVADPNPHKVNLGVGMYYDENGKLPLLECVAATEAAMVEKPAARGYLPIDGMADYDKAAQRLAFGDTSVAVSEQRIATVQCLGGTGALKVAADLLKRLRPQARVLISDPSWENHRALFIQAGFEVSTYPYYDPASHGVHFDAMLAALNAVSPDTVVVLHACCHNPTGCDLDSQQWSQVVASAQARGWIPLIDMAYQGFGRGLDLKWIKTLTQFAVGETKPHLTLLLRISDKAAKTRVANRNADANQHDRIEQSGDAFFKRVAKGYERIAKSEPRRVKI